MTIEMEAEEEDDGIELMALRNTIFYASEKWLLARAKNTFKALRLGNPEITLQEIAEQARSRALRDYQELVAEPVSERQRGLVDENAEKWIRVETFLTTRAGSVSSSRRGQSPPVRPSSSAGGFQESYRFQVRCPIQDHPRLMDSHKSCSGRFEKTALLRSHLRRFFVAFICLGCDEAHNNSGKLTEHKKHCDVAARTHRRADQTLQNKVELMQDKVDMETIKEIVNKECALRRGSGKGCVCDPAMPGEDVPRALVHSTPLNLLQASQMGQWALPQMHNMVYQTIGMEHVGGFGAEFIGETDVGFGYTMGYGG